MDEEIARCRDLAARCREMAKFAVSDEVRLTLLSMADDYENLCLERAAKLEQASGPDSVD